MEHQITEARCFWAGVAGTIIALSSFVVLGSKGIGDIISRNNNIVALLAACIIFVIATLISYGLMCLCKGTWMIKKISTPEYVFVIIAIITVILFYGMLRQDDGYAGADVSGFWWHIIPSGIVMVVFACSAVAGIYAVYAGRTWELKNRRLLYLFYTAAAIAYAGTVVYLNVYAGDMYHIDAYVHPIYNVYYNTPYSDLSYGIYGHYELFFKLPMLIFGTSPRVICATIAVVAFAEAMIIFCIVDRLVLSKVIKVMVPFALVVPTGCMFLSSSYQSTPHRIIFPVCLILYAVKQGEKQSELGKREIVLGHIICAAAVLWNTETGLICCMAWTAYIIIRTLMEKKIRWGVVISRFVGSVCITVFDIALAIIIVNIYNVCVGGDFIVQEFFYPFINGGFMHHYSIRLQFGNRPYIYILVLSFATIVYGMSRTKLFQKDIAEQKHVAVIFLTGIILLGQLTYYMTRAAYYGLLITFPFAIILIAYLGDYFCRREKRGDVSYSLTEAVKGAIAGTQIAALSILVLLSGGLGDGYAKSFAMGRYSIKTPVEALSEIKQDVLPNTYAVGWGTDEIYGDLGWNTGYHMLGTTDVLVDTEANSYVFGRLVQEANEQDYLFLSSNAYFILSPEYQLIKEYTIYGQTFGYFKKVEEL